MRLRHHTGRIVNLSCGTIVQPARDLRGVVEQLDTYASEVRGRLGADTLAVSLWLPPALAATLAVESRTRARLRAELDARGLEVVTLTGVRYGDDEPDWSSPARLEYTLDLARILVDLLPDDAVRGAISTLGLGRRAGWTVDKDRSCARQLARLSRGLAEVAWHTGRAVRVGFQPEPGAVLDTAVNTAAALATVDPERLGVCLDLANLACTWERPADALDTLAENGISVIRVQIAAALEAADPAAAAGVLPGHVNPDRRHPVTTTAAGSYFDDLGGALDDRPPGPWRIRCRTPLHSSPPSPLGATTDVAWAALRHLLGGAHPTTEYLDVDPAEWCGHPADVAGVVAAELEHVSRELSGFGVRAFAFSSR
jgi:sugar phosphate isomerase/epimerase